MPRLIQFTKMHGLGNDYVYVDCFNERLDGIDTPALSRAISDRHQGVGSDGLILICPPERGVDADVRMEMYNADGSRGEMCGNGIRCVAKYAVEHGLIKPKAESRKPKPALHPLRAELNQSMAILGESLGLRNITATDLRVQTDRGVLAQTAFASDGIVMSVRVDMGPPTLNPADVPVAIQGHQCVKHPLQVGDDRFSMTCVSMGNPHAVFFVESFAAIHLAQIGPLVERHRLFPNRVNAHFVTVQARHEATMKTWERGSGITQACGTGACAVLVAGVLEDRLDRTATIHLPGGDLRIEWHDGEESPVFMTGPANEVFRGEWLICTELGSVSKQQTKISSDHRQL
jgi:diaminopimelate epimerase